MKNKIFIGRVRESQTTNNATAKDLIEAGMRMKPDHIFLTKLKGDEARNYLGMLNTGHERVIKVEDLKEIAISK